MASLEVLNARLNQSNNYKRIVSDAQKTFNGAVEEIEPACYIKNYYTIDEESADKDDIKKQRTKILAVVSNFSQLISQIDAKIFQIKGEIRAEEARIEAERRAAAEAAAAAAAAEAAKQANLSGR